MHAVLFGIRGSLGQSLQKDFAFVKTSWSETPEIKTADFMSVVLNAGFSYPVESSIFGKKNRALPMVSEYACY